MLPWRLTRTLLPGDAARPWGSGADGDSSGGNTASAESSRGASAASCGGAAAAPPPIETLPWRFTVTRLRCGEFARSSTGNAYRCGE
jgi:hypothetical protein